MSDSPVEPDESFEPGLAPGQPRRSTQATVLRWLGLLALLALLAYGGRAAGQRLYNPPSRIPVLASYSGERGLFGVNDAVVAQLSSLQERVGGTVSPLVLTGDAYEIGLSRTLGDRLLDRRKERATVFSVRLPDDAVLRVLVLRDAATTVFAVDTVSRRSAVDGVAGTYLALPAQDDDARAAFAPLIASLTALLPRLDEEAARSVAANELNLFGAFDGGRADALKARIDGNYVLSYQVETLDARSAGVSVASPLFFVQGAPSKGRIKGVYLSRWRSVVEPLGGSAETGVLSHELTHGYIDRVLPDAAAHLRSAAYYFESSHPRLYGGVVDDLYSTLNASGRAEETLAFLMGAIASGDPKTVAPSAALQNQNALTYSEAVLKTDVELLIELGLLPPCMQPDELGHTEAEITFDYYAAARKACT